MTMNLSQKLLYKEKLKYWEYFPWKKEKAEHV